MAQKNSVNTYWLPLQGSVSYGHKGAAISSLKDDKRHPATQQVVTDDAGLKK